MTTLNDSIKAVHEAQKALKEAVSKAERAAPICISNKWLFALHSHYEKPRVSVWDKSSDLNEKEQVTFVLNGDWKILRIGDYVDEEFEVEAAFRSWLAHDGEVDDELQSN